MTTTLKPSYGTSTTITFSLASLASDTNLIAGRESNSVDNTSDLAVDSLVGGKITTGTSPGAAQIEIWAAGSYDGTTYSAGATGSDANFSPTGEKTQLKLITMIANDATSNHTYEWGPFSIAYAFGGTMPKKWSIYVVQNTGQNLHATAGNHELKYTPVQYISV